MDEGLLRDALILVLGVATGVLSGAFGVGGAVISQPGIRALGIAADLTQGTTLPSILPGAISGTLRYHRAGLIDWPTVALAVPGGLVASVGGALLSDAVPGDGHLLVIGTSALLAFTAYRMGQGGGEEAVAARAPAGPVRLRSRTGASVVAVGVVSGLLSGLLGVGGGVLMVPGFTTFARMPLKSAIATSLVCVGMFAVPGTITHALLGDIDWRVALLLSAGVVPGARIGAGLAIRAGDTLLRRRVAAFLAVVAVLTTVGELAALL